MQTKSQCQRHHLNEFFAPLMQSPEFFYVKDTEINTYPDLNIFFEALKAWHQLPPNYFFISNGADGCLDTIFRFIKQNNFHLWLPNPSYDGFETLAKNQLINYSTFQGYCPKPKKKYKNAIVFCNPANPTGELVNFDIDQLTRTFDLVVIDEAYIEYSLSHSRLTDVKNKYDNLLIVRTLSKAFGAAKLRVGYCAGTPKLISQISKLGLKYPVAGPSLKIASQLIFKREVIFEKIKNIIIERQRLTSKMIESGFKVSQSVTNFFSIESLSPDIKSSLHSYLFNQLIFTHWNPRHNILRISTGLPAENEKLLFEVTSFLKQKNLSISKETSSIGETVL